MPRLTIGSVAKQAGVNIGTLRYYERQGVVVKPPRTSSNDRVYPEETVKRVQFVKRAQKLGFSLKEIKMGESGVACPSPGSARISTTRWSPTGARQRRRRSCSSRVRPERGGPRLARNVGLPSSTTGCEAADRSEFLSVQREPFLAETPV